MAFLLTVKKIRETSLRGNKAAVPLLLLSSSFFANLMSKQMPGEEDAF
jgi:hypothetical protein